MNIYDFDGTIYDGDSCKDIILYGLKTHPMKTIKALKKANKLNHDYKKELIPFERVKETMLSFIFEIDNYQEFINDFVNSHMNKIKPWYSERKTDNDVILSASYELWLNVFAQKLGIKYVIGTKVDDDGKIIGKNCKSEEKISRFRSLYPKASIDSSYSDSKADEPILQIANNGYVVEGNDIIPYKREYKFKNVK